MATIGAIANSQRPRSGVNTDILAMREKVDTPHVGKAVTHTNNVLSVLGSEAALQVCNPAKPTDAQAAGKPIGMTGVPCIDSPDDEKAKAADLAKLILYLKMEGDQLLAELAKRRIDQASSELEQRHNEQIAQLMESLKKMDAAAKSNASSKIFGWVSAALGLIISAVSIIGSAGAALPVALAVISATMGLAVAVLQQTDVMGEWTEKLKESLKKSGLKEMASSIISSLIMTISSLAVTIGPGLGASAAAKAAQTGLEVGNKVAEGMFAGVKTTLASMGLTEETLNLVVKLSCGVLTLSGLGMQAWSTSENYEAGKTKAESTLIEKFMAVLRQHLEESQEDLQEILKIMQNDLKAIIEILSSKTDVELEIANEFRNMV